MSDLLLRTIHDSDVEPVVRLLHRSLEKERISAVDFRRKVLLDPNFRPEGAIVAEVGGKLAGFILCIVRRQPLEDWPSDFEKGWITLMGVDPEYRRQGIGDALLRKGISYLRSSGASTVWVSPYAPNYFSPGIDEAAYPEGIEFFLNRGFTVAYRPLSMEAQIHELEVPSEIAGVEDAMTELRISVRELGMQDITLLVDFVRSEFPGDWQRLVRESIDRTLADPDAPTRIFIAVRDGRCIGFARHDGERFGPFGVGESARGLGIGSLLLYRCLESMRSKGIKKAWLLWTDDRAARLYLRAGFRETRRYSVMKCAL